MYMPNHKDFAAFKAKLAGADGALFEKREAPSLDSIQKTLDKLGEAVEAHRKATDERIEELKKTGTVSPETQAKLDKIDGTIDELSAQKKTIETLITRASRPGLGTPGNPVVNAPEFAEHREAFFDWVRRPGEPERQMRVNEAVKAIAKRTPMNALERRATQVITSTGSAGGFALPEEIAREIDRLSVDISPIRQIARVVSCGTPDYKELIDIGGAAFEWLAEAATRNQTNTPDLAEVAPTFGMASAKPQATEESLDDLFFNVEDWLITSAAEAIAAGEGAAFVAGNGTKKPTGFLSGPAPLSTTDASRAFGTLQYIASAQAAAMPTTPDTFYDIVYALRARYRRNATWVTSKLVLAAMRKYKEATTNAYMWQPGLAAGQPDMFAGYPVVEAEDMPAVGAGTFPLAFGDFKEGYLIADRVGMRITRDEITSPGFVKFYIRKRVGGKLRNTQAIKLLKIAAS